MQTERPHGAHSFPRKREPRDFSRLPLGPRLRGDDEFVCPHDSLTASKAGVHRAEARSCEGRKDIAFASELRSSGIMGPRLRVACAGTTRKTRWSSIDTLADRLFNRFACGFANFKLRLVVEFCRCWDCTNPWPAHQCRLEQHGSRHRAQQ